MDKRDELDLAEMQRQIDALPEQDRTDIVAALRQIENKLEWLLSPMSCDHCGSRTHELFECPVLAQDDRTYRGE